MKKVLIFVDWYLPGFKAGGQIPSVANIIRLLKNDIDFSIVTSDRDLGDKEPYAGIELNKWITNFGVRIKYISRDTLNIKTIKNIVFEEEPDIFYFNSFFSFYFTVIALYYVKKIKPHVKIILAPRGMLGKGALKIKSLKKKLFIQLTKLVGLYNDLLWHASTVMEAEEIKAIFGNNVKVKSAIDISFPPESKKKPPDTKKNGGANFFYLSRISDKKNLSGAIDLLNNITSGKVTFDIIGPVDNRDYWENCRAAIKNLPRNITVTYRGAVPNYRIKEELEGCHFLLLPTFNENYGHSIAESLVLGKPVIISDNTPWKNLEQEKAGWDVPLKDRGRFSDVINYCINMSQEEYDVWSSSAVLYAEKIIMSPKVIKDNRELFLDI